MYEFYIRVEFTNSMGRKQKSKIIVRLYPRLRYRLKRKKTTKKKPAMSVKGPATTPIVSTLGPNHVTSVVKVPLHRLSSSGGDSHRQGVSYSPDRSPPRARPLPPPVHWNVSALPAPPSLSDSRSAPPLPRCRPVPLALHRASDDDGAEPASANSSPQRSPVSKVLTRMLAQQRGLAQHYRSALAAAAHEKSLRTLMRSAFWRWWHGSAELSRYRTAVREQQLLSRRPSVAQRARQLQHVMPDVGLLADGGRHVFAAPTSTPLSPGSYGRRGLVAEAPRIFPANISPPLESTSRSRSPAARSSTTPTRTSNNPRDRSVTERMLLSGQIVSPGKPLPQQDTSLGYPVNSHYSFLDSSPVTEPPAASLSRASQLFSPPGTGDAPVPSASKRSVFTSAVDPSTAPAQMPIISVDF
jgi:hypothetical protein